MRVWRISRREYGAFDGEGGRIASARWHRRGLPIVYTAGNLSLAALEFFVHIPSGMNLKRLVAVAADIPDSVGTEEIALSALPPRWQSDPNPESLRNLGMEWLRAARTAVLSVPSAVILQERNYLLNPAHADFSQIRIQPQEAFEFDYRMWAQSPVRQRRPRPTR